MGTRTTAKRPSVAIARVLRDFGLVQGYDFRVVGDYHRGERYATRVRVYSRKADQTILDHADLIEDLTADAGFPFTVSVYYTAEGRLWTWVSDAGHRTRQTPPEGILAPGIYNATRPKDDIARSCHESASAVAGLDHVLPYRVQD